MSEEAGISRGLNTLLKVRVHERLTQFAKQECSDPFGKWSYSIAFEKLMDIAERESRYMGLNDRIDFLEHKLMDFEAMLESKGKTTPEVPEGAKRKPVKVLGGEIE